MKELNEKLAKWVGFKPCLQDGCVELLVFNEGESDEAVLIIPFTESLDACFKWLVPKLDNTYTYALYFWDGDWIAEIHGKGKYAQTDSFNDGTKTPALALCKAIEKLIDVCPPPLNKD